MTVLGNIPKSDDLATTAHIFPVATIMPWGDTTVPSGWLPCDGRTLDGTNSLYIELYNNIGVMYGGTGQNAFKIPGLNASAANGSESRIPIGKHPGGPTEANANGKTGGALDHTHAAGSYAVGAHSHTAGTLAAAGHGHGHTISAPSHYHRTRMDAQHVWGPSSTDGAFTISAGTTINNSDVWDSNPAGFNTGAATPSTSGGITSAGAITLSGSTANDTATNTASASRGFTGSSGTSNPPYLAIVYIIKL